MALEVLLLGIVTVPPQAAVSIGTCPSGRRRAADGTGPGTRYPACPHHVVCFGRRRPRITTFNTQVEGGRPALAI